jgi:hypothetical protein
MGRRAVAATLVSVIFFSTLLLANAAVYAADGSYLSSAVLTSAQQRESGYASLLAGVSSFSSLSAAEGYLSSHPLDCSSEATYLGSMGGSDSVSGEDQGVDYTMSTTWTYVADGPTGDNLTVLGPFGGYSIGALNLLVTTKIGENILGGLPSYDGQEQHTVHLPIALEGLTSLCLSTLSLMRRSLSSLPSCNSSSVQEALDSVAASYPYLRSVDMGGSAQVSGGVCSVDYWLTIAQSYDGVSGTSDWSVFGDQTFST